MDWNNLKSNKCPECESSLESSIRFHKCTNPECDFRCSTQKFAQIVNTLYQPKRNSRIDEVDDNLSALNNM